MVKLNHLLPKKYRTLKGVVLCSVGVWAPSIYYIKLEKASGLVLYGIKFYEFGLSQKSRDLNFISARKIVIAHFHIKMNPFLVLNFY